MNNNTNILVNIYLILSTKINIFGIFITDDRFNCIIYFQKRQNNVSPQTTLFQSLSKNYSNLDINQSAAVSMKKVSIYII